MKSKKGILLLGIICFSLLNFNISKAAIKEDWERKNNKWYYYDENGNLLKNEWKYYKNIWYYLLSNGEMKENGWEKIKGDWYYFIDGEMLSNKFINYKGSLYYLGKSGAMATDTKVNGYSINEDGIATKIEEHWERKNNKWFYYDEDGNLLKNEWKYYKNIWYYLLSNGEMKENGWEKIKGDWYYFIDGEMLSNKFINYKGSLYYLGKSGAMATDTKVNGYSINEDGIATKIEEHWERKNNKWFYYDEDGNLLKNEWKYYKNIWYYLLSNGEMKENGWEKIRGNWYYFVDGEMLSNKFIDYKGNKYYLGESGAMATDTKVNGYSINEDGIATKIKEHWEKKNNKWFYYDEDGNLLKNEWKYYKNIWYYLLSNGEMKENGWEKIKGSWYYFEDGEMLSSQFLNFKGKKYYLGESGAMAVNTVVEGHTIDEDGIATKIEEHWEQKNSKWYYYGEDGNLYKNKWKYYNGSWYYLLSNGEMKENGWEKIKGSWYYFEDGKMLYSRFLYYKGEKYYLDESGVATSLSGAKLSKAKFIESITPSILKAVKGKGLFPSIAIAQACLETGFGNDSLSPAPIYNLFGIKAAKNTPASRYVEIKTAEYDENGEKYYIIAKFMKFTGYDDACEYYSNLFTRSKWLRDYYSGVIAAKTPDEAAKALTGTYATDPKYGDKLLDIIEKFGLRELDKKIYYNGVKP